jgi:hypothetical protein
MIVLYPIVLAGAFYLMLKSRQRGLGSRGGVWFSGWAFAGALFLFSVMTGLSIGLVLFPAAALAIFWLAVNAPYWREVAGFPVGAALVAIGIVLFV